MAESEERPPKKKSAAKAKNTPASRARKSAPRRPETPTGVAAAEPPSPAPAPQQAAAPPPAPAPPASVAPQQPRSSSLALPLWIVALLLTGVLAAQVVNGVQLARLRATAGQSRPAGDTAASATSRRSLAAEPKARPAQPRTATAADRTFSPPLPEKPNIIVIFVDDLGMEDLRSYGHRYHDTPNIDRLAAGGMKFTNARAAAPMCSPTRAALLTGLSPARLNLTAFLPGGGVPNYEKLAGPQQILHLCYDTTTLAEALGQAGYRSALIGKWHLGNVLSRATIHGFDFEAAATYNNALLGAQQGSMFPPWDIETIQPRQHDEYLTDRLTHEAVGFIERHSDGPFFLLLSHYAVHVPLGAKKLLVDKYRHRLSGPEFQGIRGDIEKLAVYAAMLEGVDRSTGEIMAKLAELGLTESTLIIFTSDNGAVRSTSPEMTHRGEKRSLYEAGVRIPLIMTWPGVIPPGSVCDTPNITNDLYPTITGIAGAGEFADPLPDGIDLRGAIFAGEDPGERAFYTHFPYYGNDHPPGSSVVRGRYKLLEFFEEWNVELYDLEEDPAETRNLAAERPDLADEMREDLHRWRRSVGAQMPRPNPAYIPLSEQL